MKSLCSFLLVLFISNGLLAQPPYKKTNIKKTDNALQEGISLLIDWVPILKENIHKLYSQGRKNRFIRQLGYLATDLDYLAMEKKEMSDEVIKLYFSGQEMVSIKSVEEYRYSVESVRRGLSRLLIYLDDQLQKEGRKVLDKVRLDLYNRKEIELKEIILMLSNKKEFNKEEILMRTKLAQEQAFLARDLVLELRQKLIDQ